MALGTSFTCNICGQPSVFAPVEDWREEPTCTHCRSSVRMRSIVHFLLEGLLGRSEPLSSTAPRKLLGAGLSDWEGYAEPLAELFDYTNTFFHCEPRLDICRPGPERLGRYDFLISSDVFEHVPTPVAHAFEGAFAMLRPGGLLVLTVPFGWNPRTVEHYPDLENFKVVELGDRFVVVTQDKHGVFALDTDPVFHGGPGTTLEMRLFSSDDLMADLAAAGFTDIRLHDEAVPEWGIFPRNVYGVPVTASKPANALQKLKNAVRKARPG
jgi:SAM-dependent methyltransferase